MERIQHKRHVDDSATWGASEEWELIQRIECTTVLLTSAQLVRGGKDSAERIMRVYPVDRLRKKVNRGDMLVKDSLEWQILYVASDAKYIDAKAVQG